MLWHLNSLSFSGPGVPELAYCVPGPTWGCSAWPLSHSHLEQLRHCLGAPHLALLNLLFSFTCYFCFLACKSTMVSPFSSVSGAALLLPSRGPAHRNWSKRQEENRWLHFGVLWVTDLCHPVEWNVPLRRGKETLFSFPCALVHNNWVCYSTSASDI